MEYKWVRDEVNLTIYTLNNFELAIGIISNSILYLLQQTVFAGCQCQFYLDCSLKMKKIGVYPKLQKIKKAILQAYFRQSQTKPNQTKLNQTKLNKSLFQISEGRMIKLLFCTRLITQMTLYRQKIHLFQQTLQIYARLSLLRSFNTFISIQQITHYIHYNLFSYKSVKFMQDYPKSPCLYHPSQNITNFCKEKTCLMPLCPTCICTHMDMHISEGRPNPKFDNINESFTNVTAQIRKFNQRFDDSRDQLINVQRIISEQKRTLSDMIYNLKVQVRDMVEESFTNLQKELVATIQNQNKILELHVPETLETLEKKIVEVSGKLRQMSNQLKTQRGLSTLITFNHETRNNIQKYQQIVAKEIKSNEQYAPIANINSSSIASIKKLLTQIITLKFLMPSDTKLPSKVHTQQTQTLKANNQNSIMDGFGCKNVQNVSHRGLAPKAPLNKTCLNSLRSSFGSKPQILSSLKFGLSNLSAQSPTHKVPLTPTNPKKMMDPSLMSPVQGKRKVVDARKLNSENAH